MALLAAAPTAPAAPSIVANLDRDRPWERLSVRGEAPARRHVVLTDWCHTERVEHALTRSWDSIDLLRVRELDGATRQPEILIDARGGAGGHVGVVKVVRLTGHGCPTARTIFRFSTAEPSYGGLGTVNFSVRARNFVARYPGKELRLEAELMAPGDVALCCPSRERVKFFRYDRSRGRYVPYRSFVRANDFS